MIKAVLCLWARWGRAEGPGGCPTPRGWRGPPGLKKGEGKGWKQKDRQGTRSGAPPLTPDQLISICCTPIMRQVLCWAMTSSPECSELGQGGFQDSKCKGGDRRRGHSERKQGTRVSFVFMLIPFSPLIPRRYIPLAAPQMATLAQHSGILFCLVFCICPQVPSNCFRRDCLALLRSDALPPLRPLGQIPSVPALIMSFLPCPDQGNSTPMAIPFLSFG